MTVAAWLIVEVALGKGPNDTVVDGDYTDLSDRVLGFTMNRGRDDRTQQFDPGTCSIILDNEDRELDPLRPDSWVSVEDGLGLPLCPIRVSVAHDGGTDRIFTGYIGPEAWVPITTPVAGKVAVRLDAMDRLAYAASVGLPSSPFAAATQTLAPDWWIRGINPRSLVAGVADTINDSSGNDYFGTVTTSTPGNVIYGIDSLVPGDSDSAMTTEQGVSVYTDEASLTGAQANVTMGCIWRGTPHGVDQEIIRQRDMTGSVVRWRIHCTTAGDLVAIIYNSGGTATDFVAAPANPDPDSSGRWDDDNPHLIFCRVEGGTRLRIYADGETASVTSSIPATVQGRVIFGGGNQLASFDEVMFLKRSVTLDEMDTLWGAFSETAPPYAGDGFDERIERWWDLTAMPRGGSDVEAHFGTVTAPLMAGLTDVPSNLLEAWQITTESFLGALWVTRSGVVRARTDDALTDTDFDPDYNDATAILTDDPDATGAVPVVRRTQPEFTGLRLDRVTNVFRFTYGDRIIEERFQDSIDRYGERVASYRIEALVPDGESPKSPVDSMSGDIWYPTWDVEPVTVYPLVDAAAAEWVFELLELEQGVTLQWVDAGRLYSCDLQVQGESWSWERDRLEVSVALGLSRGRPSITYEPFGGGTFRLATEAGEVVVAEDDSTPIGIET